MRTHDHGDVELAPQGCRSPRKQRQVMVGCDADHCAPAVQDRKPRKGEIAASARGIPGDDGAGGHVRALFPFEESRYGQRCERILRGHARLHRRLAGRLRRHRMGDRGTEPRQNLARVDTKRRGDPFAAGEQVAGGAKFGTHDPLEHQRGSGVGGGQERRQLERAIDRLVDPPQRALALEPGQERSYGLAIAHAHTTARIRWLIHWAYYSFCLFHHIS